MLLMISATLTSQILTTFENKLLQASVLTAFIPMLMGTGGNSGGQSSAMIIRAISPDEVGFKDIFKGNVEGTPYRCNQRFFLGCCVLC